MPLRRPADPATGPIGSGEAQLVVEGLSTHFLTPAGRIRAVDGVSFQLGAGATLGIVGESGSGKSVMARSLMGLVPASGVAQSGRVAFEGRDVLKASVSERRRIWGPGMAIVFQDPMTSLNPVMKVGHQITESLRAHLRLDRAAARHRARQLLVDVHVPEPERRLSQYPHELSGGMRQRVAIAIALACDPRLLIADEPTTALDVTIQADILDLLQELQAARGMSLILVSHDLGVVAGRTDEVAVMYAGRFVEHGTTAEVFEAARMPYTQALLQAIPRLENPTHSRLRAIPGRPPDPSAEVAGCAFAPRCTSVQSDCTTIRPQLIEVPGMDHRYACLHPLAPPARRGSVDPAPRIDRSARHG
jgi:peptide/nickel transport system ATP-binding protein